MEQEVTAWHGATWSQKTAARRRSGEGIRGHQSLCMGHAVYKGMSTGHLKDLRGDGGVRWLWLGTESKVRLAAYVSFLWLP